MSILYRGVGGTGIYWLETLKSMWNMKVERIRLKNAIEDEDLRKKKLQGDGTEYIRFMFCEEQMRK